MMNLNMNEKMGREREGIRIRKVKQRYQLQGVGANLLLMLNHGRECVTCNNQIRVWAKQLNMLPLSDMDRMDMNNRRTK